MTTKKHVPAGGSTCAIARYLAMGAIAFAVAPAFGQAVAGDVSAAPSPAGGSDIVVTARKRAESVINVPESISVVSSQKIEQAGLHSLRDFSDLTPNFNFTSGQDLGDPAIQIRGLAQAQTAEAPVAVVIDGVQLADPTFISQDFGDVERMEILRGPQGSLYGRNAIGGAINIVTRQPTNQLQGRIKVDYGNADTLQTNVYVSGPIVADKLLFSASGSYRRTDGQVENVYLGKPADGGHDAFAHGRLIFHASENLTIDLRADYGHDRLGNTLAEVVPYAQFDNFRPGFLSDNAPVVETRTLYDVSGKIDYQAGYLTLTSITGYSHLRDRNLGDADFSPAPAEIQDNQRRVHAFTEEFRISSPSDGKFRWLLGAFYQDRHTDNFLNIYADDGTGHASSTALSLSEDIGSSRSIAGFGSASYDILPRLELTVGARYDHDRRTSMDRGQPASAVDASFDAFQPKVQISYKPKPGFNLYASYAEGFSSGGFNSFVSAAISRKYLGEKARNYELGVKGSVLNGRVTFSADVFHVDYDNQQFFYATLAPPSQNVINIDKTRVNGGELEIDAHVTPQFELIGGLGVSDARIRKNAAIPSSVGNESPQNSRETINVAGLYNLPLSDRFTLRNYVSWRRQGHQYWDTTNIVKTPAKQFVNLRMTLDAGRWSFGGFVNNLTNTQYPTLAIVLTGAPVAARAASGRRTFGAEGNLRF